MRASRTLLAAGDAICLVAFALIGLRSHDESIGPGSLARVAGPFALSWAVSAWLTGMYRDHPETGKVTAARVLKAWLPAWAGGILMRAIFFSRSPFTAFSVIALLFNGLLLVSWRLGARLAGIGAAPADAKADSVSSR